MGHEVLSQLVVWLTGFSILALLLLQLAWIVLLKRVDRTAASKVFCFLLCSILIALQYQHGQHFELGTTLFDRWQYLLPLIAAPPAFFLFSRSVVFPQQQPRALDILHATPLVVLPFLPQQLIPPIVFLIGSGYTAFMASWVYILRRQASRFRFELFFFGLFAVMAAAILVVVMALPWLSEPLFYQIYAALIGSSVWLVVATLVVFPEVLNDLQDAAESAYAQSTLSNVNVDAVVRKLESLISDEKVHHNENLNLSILADTLGLGSHQLSELINSQFKMGFSRYIRQRRIADAKALLLSESESVSVMAIGLDVGFKSQSSFYQAFRELEGSSPAAWRKQQQ